MVLSRYTLKNIEQQGLIVPDESVFELPERVLQFGTGASMRGLPDYFIDKANRQGLFNGRIVGVKLNGQGDSAAFEKQDGLYTVCVRGWEDGVRVEENIINSSISRVLSAADEWEQVLECAHSHSMQVILSNTTELGIQLVNEDIRRRPPVSFPGKLLAFLYERFRAFDGSAKSGMVIVPTELIPDNGKLLESIVLELAHLNGLEEEFMEWLETHNHFCNSLVDRIVTNEPGGEMQSVLENEFGYSDQLLTLSEVRRFWAIEGSEEVRQVLSFAAADTNVVIEPDITGYMELKLRLLNGTHTLCCGLAFLAGFDTVQQAMEEKGMEAFISGLMLDELVPALPYNINAGEAGAFGKNVLDRFRNPHVQHHWKDICKQYTSKMKTRNIPVLLAHYKKFQSVPERLALGFAAYLLYTRPVRQEGGRSYGQCKDREYLLNDKMAGAVMKSWNNLAPHKFVREVLSNTSLWGEDLAALPGFCESVSRKLELLMREGARNVIHQFT
ncbi:tagaturonate reductase [Paraflavisolibacter sp. H34]|uniref:tagaturonate reductase n=1 Tax=Huijunlia imazamoxiresistens TaxID=3127457 RepID=UPI003016C8F5